MAFKSDKLCTECNGCYYIQNKKRHLCSQCVYKMNHGGKSQQEVYSERSKERIDKDIKANIVMYGGRHKAIMSEEEFMFLKNRTSQDRIEEDMFQKNKEAQDSITEEEDEGEKRFAKSLEKERKKHKPIKQRSEQQIQIDRLYKIAITNIDYLRDPVCTGCLKYQGGDIKLSHSHIISRADAHRIGKPELIYDEQNITFHCLDFGENESCHRKWENPKERINLKDYQENIKFIKSISEELYLKYTKDDETI